MTKDPVQIRVRELKNLEEPVHEFHVRIASHFAENRRAFDGFVGQRIEFAKKDCSFYFRHGVSSQIAGFQVDSGR